MTNNHSHSTTPHATADITPQQRLLFATEYSRQPIANGENSWPAGGAAARGRARAAMAVLLPCSVAMARGCAVACSAVVLRVLCSV